MLLLPISEIKATQLDATTAVLAASPEVIARQRTGRHGIAISAGESDIYLGGEDVAADKGMLVAAGTTMVLPVSNTSMDSLYVVGGSCVLTEFF